MSIGERPGSLIGILLIVVLNWPQMSSGTLISRPGPSLGGFFGGGIGGGGPLASGGFQSGGVSGAGGGSSIVFPVPSDRRSAFFGLLKLPYIICYYAAYGRWPSFPPQLHAAVLDLGRHVFAMDDYGLRNYCSKHFRVTVGHRPCCAAPAIHQGWNTGHSFDEVPTNTKPTGKRSTKKPTPAPDEIDAEVITGMNTEGDGAEEEQAPEEAEEEEPAEGDDYDAGRLQMPMVDGRRKFQHQKKGDRCSRGEKDCVPNTVPFVPLRNMKTPSSAATTSNRKQAVKNQLTTTAKPKAAVDGKVGREAIPK